MSPAFSAGEGQVTLLPVLIEPPVAVVPKATLLPPVANVPPVTEMVVLDDPPVTDPPIKEPPPALELTLFEFPEQPKLAVIARLAPIATGIRLGIVTAQPAALLPFRR